jgi:hypothetical protein
VSHKLLVTLTKSFSFPFGGTTILAMTFTKNDIKLYGTPFAKFSDGSDASNMNWYIDEAVWAGFINLFISFALSLIPGQDCMPKSMSVNSRKHGDTVLDGPMINELLKTTTEPVCNKVGQACLLCIGLISTFTLPFFGTSYDGCDIVSYTNWRTTGLPSTSPATVGTCNGPSITGGLPTWALIVIIGYIINTGFSLVAYTTWKTVDKESNSIKEMVFLGGSSETAVVVAKDEEMGALKGGLNKKQTGTSALALQPRASSPPLAAAE